MSSNNQVIIIEKRDGFYVHENPCIDNKFRPAKNNLISKHKTLRKAILNAQAYCNIYPYVEYGHIIQLLKK